MTRSFSPADTTELPREVVLARRFPDVPQSALRAFTTSSELMPKVWPCVPDQERVRYYLWASRQLRECHEAMSKAWELLHSASTTLNAVSDDLVTFAETGAVPTITDEDLDGEGVMSILFPGTREAATGPDIRGHAPPDTRVPPAPAAPTASEARQTVRSRILSLSSSDMTQRAIATEVGVSVATVNRTLKGLPRGKR